MVRRIRFIYGKSKLGFRESSGFFRYRIGKLPEGSGGPTVGPTCPGGATGPKGVRLGLTGPGRTTHKAQAEPPYGETLAAPFTWGGSMLPTWALLGLAELGLGEAQP